ncbi:MAG: hypothetical protein JXR83_13775 [Deltaproteobacteria bacterium]|nr:hypothetical protein [Deltaproteobacteria bacterium]
MGLFDFLGVGGTIEQQIERQLKKIKQTYAQPEYRRGAMDALIKIGTHEAYLALCKRFAVVSNSAYWDEEEKHWLVDTFADLGSQAAPAIREFVIKDDNVNYPIRALERILTGDEMTAFLVEALQARAPDDYRRDRGKLELIDNLGKRPMTPALVDAIMPYLHDHSDDVICKSIEVFEDWQARSVKEQFFALTYDDTMSARVQRRAAEAIDKLRLEAERDLEKLPEAVAEDYQVEGRSLIRRRAEQGSEA